MARTEIETERLRLRPWDRKHGPLLADLSSDPRVVRYIGQGEPWQADFALAVSDQQLRHWNAHDFGWRALVEKSTGETVGFSALNFLGDGAIGFDAVEFEIGWWLRPSAWGRGFGEEGGRAMLTEAFGRIGAPSVLARIQPSNAPSIRVAKALGMRREGSTKGSYGEPIEIFRITAEEAGRS